MEQLEWREAVEEARAAGESDELAQLHHRLREHAHEVFADLARAIDDRQDPGGAAEFVRRLMFMEKIQHEIDDALEALET
jgi:molecular chaperone HscB